MRTSFTFHDLPYLPFLIFVLTTLALPVKVKLEGVNMPQATLEEESTLEVPSGSGTTGSSSSTTTSTKPSGPGTLRQRFKLTVDDISKEVEELSVKLKRKVRPILPPFGSEGWSLMKIGRWALQGEYYHLTRA